MRKNFNLLINVNCIMTSKEIDANVLVAARDEYTHQLCYYLCPLIDEGFISIYKDAQ